MTISQVFLKNLFVISLFVSFHIKFFSTLIGLEPGCSLQVSSIRLYGILCYYWNGNGQEYQGCN